MVDGSRHWYQFHPCKIIKVKKNNIVDLKYDDGTLDELHLDLSKETQDFSPREDDSANKRLWGIDYTQEESNHVHDESKEENSVLIESKGDVQPGEFQPGDPGWHNYVTKQVEDKKEYNLGWNRHEYTVKETEDKGLGLFANEKLKKGEQLLGNNSEFGQSVMKITTPSPSKRNYTSPRKMHTTKHDDTVERRRIHLDHADYLLETVHVFDAASRPQTVQSELLQPYDYLFGFINGITPNERDEVEPNIIANDDGSFECSKDIGPGEELIWDYGSKYEWHLNKEDDNEEESGEVQDIEEEVQDIEEEEEEEDDEEEDEDDKKEEKEEKQEEDELSVFLTNIDLLEYRDILVANGFETFARLINVTDAVLQAIGMDIIGHRMSLLQEIKKIAAFTTPQKKTSTSNSSSGKRGKRGKRGPYKKSPPVPLTKEQQDLFDEWFPNRCTVVENTSTETFSIGKQMRYASPHSYNNYCEEKGVKQTKMGCLQFNKAIRDEMEYQHPEKQPRTRHDRKQCFDRIEFDCCSESSRSTSSCPNYYCPNGRYKK